MEELNDGMVVLLEGTRRVLKEDEEKLTLFAEKLATRYPKMIFRSGNAKGSDELFAKGVELIKPEQMEQVLPYPNANRSRLHKDSRILSLDELRDNEISELANLCIEATPAHKGLIQSYTKTRARNRLTVKAMYLLRDVLKVTGLKRLDFRPADAGVFYLDYKNPEGGGTGHTIRICKLNNVSVITQHG